MSLSEGKKLHMHKLSNKDGIIAAAAMDQRGSLLKSLAAAKGVAPSEISQAMMEDFKTAVVRALTPHATAILLDTEFGLPAAKARASNAGLLLAYEKTGYDATVAGRLPDLLPDLSALRIKELGADAVKILLYYTPEDDAKINEIKHAFIERIGSECQDVQIPFFLEFIGYDHKGGDEKGLEYAKAKPAIVMGCMKEFTKPRYQVDVLKVEVPVNAEFVEGSSVYKGQKAYTRAEALEYYRQSADVTELPFIYLSAGVSNAQFTESLAMAGEAGTPFSGVLCGRATWKDGIPVYAQKGMAALEDWLATEGMKNINAVNEALKPAKPWWNRLS